MSDQYTPTTEEVREEYRPYGFKSWNRAEFDRWLADVKAEAWEQGYLAAPVGPHPRRENPYREQGTP